MQTTTRDAPGRARDRQPSERELPGAGLPLPAAPAPRGSAFVTAIYLGAAAACLAVGAAAAVGLAF